MVHPTQAPAEHMPVVPPANGQLVPSSAFARMHPDAGSQVSTVHGFPSSQSIGAPLVHAPPLQASPAVQASPSSHSSVLSVCVHPLAGSQPSSVQTSSSSQSTGVPPTQSPSAQASSKIG